MKHVILKKLAKHVICQIRNWYNAQTITILYWTDLKFRPVTYIVEDPKYQNTLIPFIDFNDSKRKKNH